MRHEPINESLSGVDQVLAMACVALCVPASVSPQNSWPILWPPLVYLCLSGTFLPWGFCPSAWNILSPNSPVLRPLPPSLQLLPIFPVTTVTFSRIYDFLI